MQISDGQTLPVDQDAERAILAWLMTEDFYGKHGEGSAREFFYKSGVDVEQFHLQHHRDIFREISRRIQAEKTEPLDGMSIRGVFDDETMRALVLELASPIHCAGLTTAEHMAERLREAYRLRHIAKSGSDIVTAALSGAQSSDLIGKIEALAYDLTRTVRSELVPYKQAVTDTFEEVAATRKSRNDGHVIGLATGLADLDDMMGGLHPRQLITIAGRPGEGKSALALKILDSVAEVGKRVNFQCLEMGVAETIKRHFAMKCRIDHTAIRLGYITEDDQSAINDYLTEMAYYQAWINVSNPQTPEGIHADVYKTKPDLVIVDYLQIVEPSSTQRERNREREVAAMANALKRIAMKHNIPVIMLSQMNREYEKRANGEPQKSDLRESGEIEQCSDVVMFVYRPDWARDKHLIERYNLEESDIGNTRIVKIAKQRNASEEKIIIRFEPQYVRFDNLERNRNHGYGFRNMGR